MSKKFYLCFVTPLTRSLKQFSLSKWALVILNLAAAWRCLWNGVCRDRWPGIMGPCQPFLIRQQWNACLGTPVPSVSNHLAMLTWTTSLEWIVVTPWQQLLTTSLDGFCFHPRYANDSTVTKCIKFVDNRSYCRSWDDEGLPGVQRCSHNYFLLSAINNLLFEVHTELLCLLHCDQYYNSY